MQIKFYHLINEQNIDKLPLSISALCWHCNSLIFAKKKAKVYFYGLSEPKHRINHSIWFNKYSTEQEMRQLCKGQLHSFKLTARRGPRWGH